MTLVDDLQGYVAECERKIAALERRTRSLETETPVFSPLLRLNATIRIASRDATNKVIELLREGLDTVHRHRREDDK